METLKEKLKQLSKIARETLGVSPQLHLLKDGSFRIALLHGNTSGQNVLSSFADPEDAVEDAIEYIVNKRRPIDRNDQRGGSLEAVYTIKKELAW